MSWPAVTDWPSSTVRVWMRPGIFELTSTSLASTVPISSRSAERRVVARYQTSDPSIKIPRIMKTLFRAFIVSPKALEHHRIQLVGHGRVGEHSRSQLSPQCPIYEERLPQKLDQCLPPQRQRFGFERLERQHQTPNRRAEKIEDVGSQRRHGNLQRVHVDQLARRDALAHQRLEHDMNRPKDALDQDGQSARLALVMANHLLVHQALKLALRKNAVKVIQRCAQHPLAGAGLAQKDRHVAVSHLASRHFQSGLVKLLLALEVVVEECLVHRGG